MTILLGVIVNKDTKETLGTILKECCPSAFNPFIGEIVYRGTVSDFEDNYLCQIEEVQISRWINKNKKLIISESWMNHYDTFDLFEKDCELTNVNKLEDKILVLEINKEI